MRVIESRMDGIGYRYQLNRVMRLLDRLYRVDDEMQFHDDMFSFFMHCFHLLDWIETDPAVPSAAKRKVRQALAGPPRWFAVCRDLAAGIKHVKITDPRSGTGARYTHDLRAQQRGSDQWMYDVIFDDGKGTHLSGVALALKAVNEWREILKAAGLASTRHR